MSIVEALAAGVAGGGIVAFLSKDGNLSVINKRPIRKYTGYPTVDAADVLNGTQEFVIEPPQGYGWEILGAAWDVWSDANPGWRVPYIDIQPLGADPAVFLPVILPPIPAATQGYYYLLQGAGALAIAVAPGMGWVLPLPLKGELKNERCTCGIMGGLVGDAHRMFIYYEEFEL